MHRAPVRATTAPPVAALPAVALPTAALSTAALPATALPGTRGFLPGPRAGWWRAWVRPLVAAGILAVLVWRLGSAPFLAGLRAIDGTALAAALGIGAVTTVCCAWRWSLVAGGLGVRLPVRTAVADCYRSVFLNATLPGGVLGDVHRAVRHGRDVGDVGRAVRAVVWERTAGQAVQLVLAAVVLLTLPSPVRSAVPAAAAVAVALGLGAVLLVRVAPGVGAGRLSRPLRTARADIRDGLLARGRFLRILLASAVVVTGHVATFLVAARTAGSVAPVSRLVPLALLALLAMGVPAAIGGFGPREGVTAWAFGAAGLTAAQGLSTAVVYGALVLVASLPGALVLVLGRRCAADSSAATVPSGADRRIEHGHPQIDGRRSRA